jgi:hypothetical protein
MPVLTPRIACEFGRERPDLSITYTCVSGDCEGGSGTLKWDPVSQTWHADGYPGDPTVGWSESRGTYTVYTRWGDGNNADLTFRCGPYFKAVALGVGPDERGCYYDVTIEALHA